MLYFAVKSRLVIPATAVNHANLKKALSANIYVDYLGQPRSAPLLLHYQPLIGNFLKGLTVPRAQETPIKPSILYAAQPALTDPQVDHSDLIPTREVSEMAPVDPYELMGKKAKGRRRSLSLANQKSLEGAYPR